MDWLFASIDPSRPHIVGFDVSWHARSMVLAWVFIAPIAVIITRYFKILPGQDWPQVLDNQIWWRSHWIGQSCVFVLSAIGLVLVVSSAARLGWHGTLGYLTLFLMCIQVGFGMFRGTKGGPTSLAVDGTPRGDHYDMTLWRVAFEWTHKTTGYLTLFLAMVVVILGLWEANAPRWMWIVIIGWYVSLFIWCVTLQKQNRAVDTYQAIWGPDSRHPGNQRKPIGWGLIRCSDHKEGE